MRAERPTPPPLRLYAHTWTRDGTPVYRSVNMSLLAALQVLRSRENVGIVPLKTTP